MVTITWNRLFYPYVQPNLNNVQSHKNYTPGSFNVLASHWKYLSSNWGCVMAAVTYFRVLREDVVHQAFVPRPQRPTAATNSCNKQDNKDRSIKQRLPLWLSVVSGCRQVWQSSRRKFTTDKSPLLTYKDHKDHWNGRSEDTESLFVIILLVL